MRSGRLRNACRILAESGFLYTSTSVFNLITGALVNHSYAKYHSLVEISDAIVRLTTYRTDLHLNAFDSVLPYGWHCFQPHPDPRRPGTT